MADRVYASTHNGQTRYLLFQGGLISQLNTPDEITNALFSHNLDLAGPQDNGQKTITFPDLHEEYIQANGQKAIRPMPLWLTDIVLQDFVDQRNKALGA